MFEKMFVLLFPKLFFSFADDPGTGGGDPNGQPGDGGQGNAGGDGGASGDTTPTDFVDFKGVKIPASEFEALAKEKYKDRFEAFENREKWQAENTRKAQELAEIRRKAEAYDGLTADPRFQSRANPQDRHEQEKSKYVQQRKQMFPDVDPRFFEMQFDDLHQVSEQRAKEALQPFILEQGETFERNFLKAHPDIIKGSPRYSQIASMIQAGFDAEQAYEMTAWGNPESRKSLISKEIEAAVKARDEDAKRKLQQSRQNSSQSTRPQPQSRSERIKEAMRNHGVEI